MYICVIEIKSKMAAALVRNKIILLFGENILGKTKLI